MFVFLWVVSCFFNRLYRSCFVLLESNSVEMECRLLVFLVFQVQQLSRNTTLVERSFAERRSSGTCVCWRNYPQLEMLMELIPCFVLVSCLELCDGIASNQELLDEWRKKTVWPEQFPLFTTLCEIIALVTHFFPGLGCGFRKWAKL